MKKFKLYTFKQWLACWAVKEALRESYSNARHSDVIIVVLGTMFNELQENFREDNTATTTACIIENLIPVTTMKKSHPMRIALEKIFS